MFKQQIITVIAKQTGLKKEELENLIETPPSIEFGDYAFPCFILSKKLNKNPNEISKELSVKISPSKEIEKIEARGPYLNFFINKKKLAKHVTAINDNFGAQKQKERIILEHTSVNPNASPHVGRTRNSIIGDSIYRILTFLGNKVERHYYVNDVSKQVAMLALAFDEKDKFKDLLKKYIEITKKIENDPKLEEKVFWMLKKFESKDSKTVKLFKKLVDVAVNGQKKVFSSIGIEFDYFDYESSYMESSKQVLKELEKTGKLFKDREGRLVLDLKHTALINKLKNPVLVLTRSDGTGLYALRDIAYTIEKCKKARNILVLGEDQKTYFEQLKEALKILNKPPPQVAHYSFVLLKGIGKMSTRRGELVLLEEFLNHALKKAQEEIKRRKTQGDPLKVAIAAVKYSMLRNENDKNIVFDLKESLNFEGNTGPYLQYSYARASSIIRKSKLKARQKINTKTKQKIKIPELTKNEILLIKKTSEFPEKVIDASRLLSPSIIANYSYELAKTFNEFYHSSKVIGNENEAFRLKLVEAFRKTLKNSLWLLGIEVMEEM